MIDVWLVERLVAAQFPRWSDLRVVPVDPQGNDNRTFRLGTHLSVRLPSAADYQAQVDKEHSWLPVLAPHLPLPVPSPVARGVPGEGYPFAWSVYAWLDGEAATEAAIAEPSLAAASLARFLVALRQIEPAGGPPPGQHCFWRGGPLATYDAETRRTIDALRHLVDADATTGVWDTALAARWAGPPAWFHGDVVAGNLLVREGRLAAVLDFGCCGVGDPACDVTIAWTLFHGSSREVFRAELGLDEGIWARGRGWALWKALITIAEHRVLEPAKAAAALGVVDAVLAEHRAART